MENLIPKHLEIMRDCKDYLIKAMGYGNSSEEFTTFITNNQRTYTKFSEHKTKKGIRKLCYYNAQMLTLADPLVRYVEGLATTRLLNFPVDHGFCIDEENRIIDPTWEEGVVYQGVVIPTEFITRMVLKEKTSRPFLWDYYERLKNGN